MCSRPFGRTCLSLLCCLPVGALLYTQHAGWLSLQSPTHCAGHAEDALAFFDRCRAGLLDGGIIVVKENICTKGFVVDKVWHGHFDSMSLHLHQLFGPRS